MNKHLLTIGFEIPGFSDNCVDINDSFSLMDADVLLVSPESLVPRGDWVNFTAGGGCYDVETSKKYQDIIYHLRKEITDHLNSGKTVFLLLSKKEEYRLARSVSTLRKGEYTYNNETIDNYSFLPINIGSLTSASGKHIKFNGNSIFGNFYKKFKNNLEYQLYIENPNASQVIFTGKDIKKILGAIFKVGPGHLVALPIITFNEEDFTDIKKGDDGEDEAVWNKKGITLGNSIAECLLEIDNKLTCESEKTPAPEWTRKRQFCSKKEIELQDTVAKNCEKISKIEQENEKLKIELEEEAKLKDLLFEQGKPLENAVIKALRILGYQAVNYDDGDLEMDQVIISPERNRYIGECEGKDNKDIDITKFRQLQDALIADFARDEVEEKAFGILFGNAERLKDLADRKLDFTIKCKSGAEREKIALLKTIDLFVIAKYLNENTDDNFKKSCRDAIHQHLGKIVIFPEIPNKE